VFTSTATAVVDKAVFQEVDFGENCPGFGGSGVTPITFVNTASVAGCVDACFHTAPSLLALKNYPRIVPPLD